MKDSVSKKVLVLLLVTIAAAWLLPSTITYTQPQKKNLKDLSEELGLTQQQSLDLKSVLKHFYDKRQALNEEAEGLEPGELQQREKRLQREFFDELSQVLTPAQIEEYNRIIRTDTPPETAKVNEGETPPPPAVDAFPWLTALQHVLHGMDLSGLQMSAVDEMVDEIQSEAAQMMYLDQDYEIAEDPALVSIVQTRLQWILTEPQYGELVVALEKFLAEKNGNGSSASNGEPETPSQQENGNQ